MAYSSQHGTFLHQTWSASKHVCCEYMYNFNFKCDIKFAVYPFAVCRTQFTAISKYIRNVIAVNQYIFVMFCRLTSLPLSFLDLKHLKALWLSENQVNNLNIRHATIITNILFSRR